MNRLSQHRRIEHRRRLGDARGVIQSFASIRISNSLEVDDFLEFCGAQFKYFLLLENKKLDFHPSFHLKIGVQKVII